jgi:hypothetical protein
MARDIRDADDEIDLVALVLLFWGHRGKFATLAMIGLVLGLAFTYQHAPRYVTDFKVAIGHPIYSEELLVGSLGMQRLLDKGVLDPVSLPRLTYQKKSATFQVVTDTPDIRALMQDQIRQILAETLSLQQALALKAQSYDDSQVILRNPNGKVSLSNRDIGNIDVNTVLDQLHLTFSPTEALYPYPTKHGALGLLAGLFLAGCWVLVSLFTQALREKPSSGR